MVKNIMDLHKTTWNDSLRKGITGCYYSKLQKNYDPAKLPLIDMTTADHLHSLSMGKIFFFSQLHQEKREEKQSSW